MDSSPWCHRNLARNDAAGARKYYAEQGRTKAYAQFIDSQSRHVGKQNQSFKCSGLAYMGFAKRPDTGEAIKTFKEFLLFGNSKVEGSGKALMKCNASSFQGADPTGGAEK